MINLREIAEERGYRITPDESAEIDPSRAERPWYYQIPCARGHIWVWGKDMLAAYCDRPRLFPKLWAIPGVQRYQTGDEEINVKFPLGSLEQVAELLQARRKRRLTPEQIEKQTERLAKYRFSAQEEPGSASKAASGQPESGNLSA